LAPLVPNSFLPVVSSPMVPRVVVSGYQCYSGQIAAAEGADQCLLCSAFLVGKGIWGRLIYYLIENSYRAFIFIGQSLPPFSGL
jgi:hypothetical protein